MSMISKVLGIWAVSKTVSATTPLFLRLILGMAAITVMSVVAAILIVMLITGGLWMFHSQLILAGATPALALMMTGLIVLLMLAIMAMVAQNYWRKVKHITTRMMNMQAPVSSRMTGLADAFMDGFMSPQPR